MQDSALRDLKPRIAFVTPTHQFPTGVTMGLNRRLALLQWARDSRAWIFEDDYDSEFRYSGRRFDPLWVLDQGDRVIYAGTFSKVMFPALRLGYLVLPEGLLDSFEAVRVSSDIHRPHLEQVAMAAFMNDGHFARHLRRSAELHAERRQELLGGLAAELAGMLVVEPAESGLHLLARLPSRDDDVRLCAESGKRGIEPWPLSIHHLDNATPGMLLGFGGSDPMAIRKGVQTLANVLQR